MAERPRAAAPGRSQVAHPAPGAQRTAPSARPSTARVSPPQGVLRSELPGWFWGALGCLTVLVVGLSVVFLMGQTGPAPTPPVATAKAVRAAPAPPPAPAHTSRRAAPPPPPPARPGGALCAPRAGRAGAGREGSGHQDRADG